MIKKAFLFLFLLSIFGELIAQDQPADSLLADLLQESVPESSDLLPEKMLFTQRFFWGDNGLYRKVGLAPKVLTSENRERELKIRRGMFRFHQGLGLATAAAMVAQGIVGAKLYKSYDSDLKDIHEGIATGINIGYFSTALLSFTSPPPMVNRSRFDNIKLHKILSVVHLSGMITTNVLARQIDDSANPANLKKWHRGVAMTTFGAYALAIASIKFEF